VSPVSADALKQDLSAFCPPTPPTIVVNGALDEIVWQIPAVVSGFVTNTGSAPREQTQAWVAYSKEGIYFAFSCDQAKMAPANSPAGKEPSKDDSVEVLIDGSGHRVACDRFVLSAAGAKFHEQVGDEGRGAMKRDPKLDWQGVAKIDQGKWTAEIYIPYSGIGIKIDEGTVLRANVCRNNAVANEITCWTGAGGSPNQALDFGNLVMGIPLYPIRFAMGTSSGLAVGTTKLPVSCDNRWQSDMKLVATLFPGGKVAKVEPAIVAAGKTGVCDLTLKIDKPGRINLRLAAVDSKTGKPLGESSFGADVKAAK
jgi:hypothetical protein